MRKKRRKRIEAGTERPHGGPRSRSLAWGGTPRPRGKRGSPGIHVITCAPIVAESLWRPPASQRRVAPGRGNSGQRCMAASLAPARCSFSKLVRHALRSGGLPLHGYLGRGMAGGSCTELELRETPRRCPHRSHKEICRPPSQRDLGQDHAAHGPLGEGPVRWPGGGRQGGKGCPRGQVCLWRRGGG